MISISPSAQTGLFNSVGPLSPHGYRPNEFFSNNWIYEGLTSYGGNGEILPALASSWTERDGPNGTYIISFTLRKDVKFHDGTPWNAEVAAANFDNVLAKALLSEDYHGWYDLPSRLTSWEVKDEFAFDLVFNSPYYPALQELTYIRPLRMLSKAQMPENGNTCPRTWGTVEAADGSAEAICEGHISPIGTGPYVFVQTITNKRVIGLSEVAIAELEDDEVVQEVHFDANPHYWGGKPEHAGLIVRRYNTHEDVLNALSVGSLDVAYGTASMTAGDFKEATKLSNLETFISPPLNTRLVVINSANGPTSSLSVRKAIVHGINKASMISNDLGGIEEVAHSVFSRNLPYCDVDLFPLMDFDFEKAKLLLDADGWVMPANGTGIRSKNGTLLSLEFIYVKDDAVQKALEDDVRKDLAELGIDVVAVPLPKDDWNSRAQNGDFSLAFSESWGSPYDPHSFAASWRVPDEASFAAQQGMRNDIEGLAEPMNKTELDETISRVLLTENIEERTELWKKILTAIHEQAIYLPISYLANTAVINRRLDGFEFGKSQFDIPAHKLRLAGQMSATNNENNSSGLSGGAIAGIAIASCLALAALVALAVLIAREKRGSPVFAPLLPKQQQGSSIGLDDENEVADKA
ncbi:putative Nickel-binding periplasmic protein [Nannochloris sp. 'desiccata']|nr:hypothetical protein KSW81_004747 [Chlorella desiccata (nom. nud.)]KAH7618292.1 putative Nickel-binding periplasmic protein [Chlorella desiccata (nom. nud.)]